MNYEKTIYEDIQRRLVTGQFPTAQKLRPDLLRTEYGCSASTIRESLFRLAAEGLVDFREQRGFRVPEISPVLIHELTHLRILLECEGAALSARNGTVEWEARLSAAHHKLAHIEHRITPPDVADDMVTLWNAAELEFHQTLIDASGSATLIAQHLAVYLRFRQQQIVADRKFIHIRENEDQHHAILEAALDHDEARLRDTITAHLSRTMLDALPALLEPEA